MKNNKLLLIFAISLCFVFCSCTHSKDTNDPSSSSQITNTSSQTLSSTAQSHLTANIKENREYVFGFKAAEISEQSLDIYLTNTGYSNLYQFYDDTKPKGTIAIHNKKTDQSYTVADFANTESGWGSLTHIKDEIFCVNNLKEILFIDLNSLTTIDLKLDITLDKDSKIEFVTYDKNTETYLLLYSDDFIRAKTFDKNGKLINDYNIIKKSDFKEIERNDNIYNSIQFSNNYLKFVNGDLEKYFNIIDLKTNTVEQTRCDFVKYYDDSVILYYDDQGNFNGKLTLGLFENNKYKKSVAIEKEDLNFYESLRDVNISDLLKYDIKTKSLNFNTGIFNYTVDFNLGTYKYHRSYSEKDLVDLIATSPDGTIDLYWANGNTDIVAKNKSTGKITFLCSAYVLNAEIKFINKDLICVLDTDKIEFFNAKTLTQIKNIINFDYKPFKDSKGNEQVGRYTTGITYDSKNGLYLIAYCNNFFNKSEAEQNKEKVYVNVYNKNGKLVKEIDTGISPVPQGEYRLYPINFKLKDNGIAEISAPKYGVLKEINYLK